MTPFFAAIRFLTIFPLPGRPESDCKALARSLPYFPVVGLSLGCIGAGLSSPAWTFFPPMVAAVLMTAVLMGLSGGLHLDGLADTADGFFSARPRARILEIMRDSRIGAMGVIALIMILLLKVTSLASLDRGQAMRAVFLMPIAGRCSLVIFMALLPYARKEGGLATLFYSRRSRWAGAWALFFFFVFTLFIAGWDCLLPILFFFILTVLVFALVCKKIIGGATGDTLGAVCELSEACTALSFAVLAWSSQ